MKRFLLFLLCMLGLNALAYDVQFPLQNFASENLVGRKVLITPIALTNTPGYVPSYDPKMYTTTNTGYFWISNMVCGSYYMEIQEPPAKTKFTLFIPSGTGGMVADTALITGTNFVASQDHAYSIQSSDQRYLHPTNSPVEGYVPEATGSDSRWVAIVGGQATNSQVVVAGPNITVVSNGLLRTVSLSTDPFITNTTGIGTKWFSGDDGDQIAVIDETGFRLLSGYHAVFGGSMTGNGAGLTNLSGTNIQAGTINSNKLDAATLAMFGTGSGSPQTNISYLDVTNAPWANTNQPTIYNPTVAGNQTNTGNLRLSGILTLSNGVTTSPFTIGSGVSGNHATAAAGEYLVMPPMGVIYWDSSQMSIFGNTNHSGSRDELQITANNDISLNPGYGGVGGRIQAGSSGYDGTAFTFQYSAGGATAELPLGYSIFTKWSARALGYGAYEVGARAECMDTNGPDVRLRFYNPAPGQSGVTGEWQMWTGTWQGEMMTNGWKFGGKVLAAGTNSGDGFAGNGAGLTNVPVGAIAASGTPSGSTVLFGNGTWAVPSAGAATNVYETAESDGSIRVLTNGLVYMLSASPGLSNSFIATTMGRGTNATLVNTTNLGAISIFTSPTGHKYAFEPGLLFLELRRDDGAGLLRVTNAWIDNLIGPDGQWGAQVAQSGVVSKSMTATNVSGGFSGEGSGITNLDASNLASGTLPLARLPTLGAAYPQALTNFDSRGAYMTNLNAIGALLVRRPGGDHGIILTNTDEGQLAFVDQEGGGIISEYTGVGFLLHQGYFSGNGSGLTNPIGAITSDQFVTLRQLDAAVALGEVYFFNATNFASGFSLGTTRTNWATPTVPQAASYTVSGVTNGQYIGAFLSTNTFLGIASGLASADIYASFNSGAGRAADLVAELYIVNDTTKTNEYEYPAPSAKAATATVPTQMSFTVPVTDYSSTTNLRVMVRIKVASQNNNPDITIYTGGTNAAHMAFTVPGSTYVRIAGDTMTGNLTVPTLTVSGLATAGGYAGITNQWKVDATNAALASTLITNANLANGTNLSITGLRTNGASVGAAPTFTGSNVSWVVPAGSGDVVAAANNNFTGSNAFHGATWFGGSMVVDNGNSLTTVSNLLVTGTETNSGITSGLLAADPSGGRYATNPPFMTTAQVGTQIASSNLLTAAQVGTQIASSNLLTAAQVGTQVASSNYLTSASSVTNNAGFLVNLKANTAGTADTANAVAAGVTNAWQAYAQSTTNSGTINNTVPGANVTYTWSVWSGPTNTLTLANGYSYYQTDSRTQAAVTNIVGSGTWQVLVLVNTNAATTVYGYVTGNAQILGTAATTANTNGLTIAAGKAAYYSFAQIPTIRTNYSNTVQQ